MSSWKTRAIVLARARTGDSSQVVTFFTEARGKVAALARGVARSRKRIAGGLQAFAIYDVVLTDTPSMELAIVDEAALVDANTGCVGDLERFERATHVLDVLQALLSLNQAEPTLFADATATLGAIAGGVADKESVVRWELRALAGSGLAPSLDRCAVCGRRVPPDRSARFDPRKGGVVCRQDGLGPLLLGAGALRVLGVHEGGATARDLEQAHAALHAFFEAQMGKPIKRASARSGRPER